MTLALTRKAGQRESVDSARRFRFSYPASFGTPSPGTNDGFEDRVAAIRFAALSTGIGGEAAVGIIQVWQDVSFCQAQFPALVPRPIGVQFLPDGAVAVAAWFLEATYTEARRFLVW